MVISPILLVISLNRSYQGQLLCEIEKKLSFHLKCVPTIDSTTCRIIQVAFQ